MLMLAQAGCGGGDVAILESSCAFAEERHLASLDGAEVDDLALAPRPGGGWATWSEESGLSVLALGLDGEAISTPRRDGPPCTGGLDAAATPTGGLLIACGLLADDAKADPGHALVYEVSEDAARVRDRFSPLGPGSRGVAIASGESGYRLAWHDARDGSGAVWSIDVPYVADTTEVPAELRDMVHTTGPTPVRVSRHGLRAGPPALSTAGSRTYLSWAETSLDSEGDPIGDVFVMEDSLAPRSIATVQHELADPVLSSTGEDVLVTFRDRRDRGRPRAYTMWLPSPRDNGTLAGGAPANTLGPALGIPCMGSVLMVAPRTHSRHERLVSVRRHDLRTLEGIGPELQLFESGAAYEHAAALCVARDGSGSADELLVLYASRESDEHRAGELHSTAVRCVGLPAE